MSMVSPTNATRSSRRKSDSPLPGSFDTIPRADQDMRMSASPDSRALIVSVHPEASTTSTNSADDKIAAMRAPFAVLGNTQRLWGLGITVVLGGQFFSWNTGLSAGLGSFVIATALVSFAYFTLVCSLAEMSSTLQVPMSGGSFFFATATIGRLPGFIVGCCEAFEFIAYVSATVVVLGQMMTTVTGLSSSLEPLWWLCFFATSLPIHLRGGHLFWRFVLGFAIFIMLIELVYILATPFAGASSIAEFAAWPGKSGSEKWFVGGLSAFLAALPQPAWFYIGVETLTLTSEEVPDHKLTVGRGLISTLVTLIAMSWGVLFAAVCQAPGIEAFSQAAFALSPGFSRLLNISDQWATLISIPATYATIFGFQWAYGRQMHAMARSSIFNILPSCLARTTGKFHTPVVSLCVCSLAAFVLALLGWLAVDPTLLGPILFGAFQIGAVVSYTMQMVAYLLLHYKYHNVPRAWRSPLGPAGAVLSFLIFVLVLIGVLFFQAVSWQPVVVLLVWAIPWAIYWVWQGRHLKSATSDEICALFILHTVKANRLMAQRIRAPVANKYGRNINSVSPPHGETGTAKVPTPSNRGMASRSHEHEPMSMSRPDSNNVMSALSSAAPQPQQPQPARGIRSSAPLRPSSRSVGNADALLLPSAAATKKASGRSFGGAQEREPSPQRLQSCDEDEKEAVDAAPEQRSSVPLPGAAADSEA